MRIYIAGASAELDRAESAIAAVRALGHTVVHDWPAVIRKVRHEQGRSDGDLTRAEASDHADEDLAAVRGCDLFWLLVPIAPSSGCWVELGFAFGIEAGADMVIVSGEHRRWLFASLSDDAFDDDALALAWLKARS